MKNFEILEIYISADQNRILLPQNTTFKHSIFFWTLQVSLTLIL